MGYVIAQLPHHVQTNLSVQVFKKLLVITHRIPIQVHLHRKKSKKGALGSLYFVRKGRLLTDLFVGLA
jgi:hypothetical protein